jgi:hypothetical protein
MTVPCDNQTKKIKEGKSVKKKTRKLFLKKGSKAYEGQ